jgi:hypothetical protein
MSSDIIYLTGLPLFRYQIDSPAVIRNIQPVPYVLTISVDRNFLPGQTAFDTVRKKFLFILVRTVIIGTAGNEDRKSWVV